MGRLAVFVYGFVNYCVFLGVFLYAIGFTANMVVPKSIDTGEARPIGAWVIGNVLLLAFFALQHSIMARPIFKKWWTTIVPKPAERSTYVLMTNVALGLLFWRWQPIAGTIWHVENSTLAGLLTGISLAGWGLVLYSTFVINHFDLFGLRQVWLYYNGTPYTKVEFQISTLYRWVRHPLLLGFMIAFWATPHMSAGHLMFAIMTTCYMLVAIQLEERDLLAEHGEPYQAWRTRVPMLIPMPPKGEQPETAGP